MPLRIASIHSAFGERGGAERSILEQAHWLNKNHETTLFVTYARSAACYPNLMRGLDIRQLVGISIPKFPLVLNAGLALPLADTFRNEFKHYDVLLSHQEPAYWVAYKSRRPYVVQIHSVLSVLYPEYFKTFPWDTDFDRIAINMAVDFGGRWILKQIDQAAVRGARKVLVQGRKLGEIIHGVYDVTPLLVPYALDLTTYRRTDPRHIFSKYSITRPLILMVTRALPSKRPDVMIRVFSKVIKDHPTATLAIVCERSPLQNMLGRLARRLGVIDATRILTVPPSEINAFYSGASVVGYPTQALEAVGRVVIEAMCFGVPPVVWDNEWGPAEVVKEGVGLRAKPYDVNDFADKVLSLLNDNELRRRIGARAKSYSQSFSWEKAGPHYERALYAAAAS